MRFGCERGGNLERTGTILDGVDLPLFSLRPGIRPPAAGPIRDYGSADDLPSRFLIGREDPEFEKTAVGWRAWWQPFGHQQVSMEVVDDHACVRLVHPDRDVTLDGSADQTFEAFVRGLCPADIAVQYPELFPSRIDWYERGHQYRPGDDAVSVSPYGPLVDLVIPVSLHEPMGVVEGMLSHVRQAAEANPTWFRARIAMNVVRISHRLRERDRCEASRFARSFRFYLNVPVQTVTARPGTAGADWWQLDIDVVRPSVVLTAPVADQRLMSRYAWRDVTSLWCDARVPDFFEPGFQWSGRTLRRSLPVVSGPALFADGRLWRTQPVRFGHSWRYDPLDLADEEPATGPVEPSRYCSVDAEIAAWRQSLVYRTHTPLGPDDVAWLEEPADEVPGVITESPASAGTTHGEHR